MQRNKSEDPDSTTVEAPPPKTPEEMQAEAEQEGWLQIWHEFTWYYPWYRFHIVYLLDGQYKEFDVGIGLIGLFGGNSIIVTQHFLNRLGAYVQDIVGGVIDIFTDYILGELAALVGAMSGNIWIWSIGVLASIAAKLALLSLNWNSIESLRASYVAQWISIMIEVGTFIYEFSLGSLLKIAQGLVKITSVIWSLLTISANLLVDIVIFISMIDGRLAALGGR